MQGGVFEEGRQHNRDLQSHAGMVLEAGCGCLTRILREKDRKMSSGGPVGQGSAQALTELWSFSTAHWSCGCQGKGAIGRVVNDRIHWVKADSQCGTWSAGQLEVILGTGISC